MGLGDNMLYKATYIKKNGKLPFGVEVQFLSDRYKSEYFLFNGKLLPSNFEKEIVAACKKEFGIDVSLEFGIDAGRAFHVECLTYRKKYPEREAAPSTFTSQSEESGCLFTIKQLLWRIVKTFIWSIILIVIIFVIALFVGK